MKLDLRKVKVKELAGLVSEELRKEGVDSTLVGGACVTIYSNNKYMSRDLDFVTDEPLRKIGRVLKEIGFEKKGMKYFESDMCPFSVEFLNAPVAIGNEVPVKKFDLLKTEYGYIKILTPTDSVKDRLAGYFYWSDPQSLLQAVMIYKANKVNLKEIERWAVKEGQREKYREFEKKIKREKL